MTKDELIAKQQIEIEELKLENETIKHHCHAAANILCRPEQWSMKCSDFPKVAMSGICSARRELEIIISD